MSKCSCGRQLAECGNPLTIWYPQRSICYPEMETAAANRMYRQLHEDMPYHDGSFTHWAKEANPHAPYHYQDGVTIYVATEDINPDDDFLTDKRLAVSVDYPE